MFMEPRGEAKLKEICGIRRITFSMPNCQCLDLVNESNAQYLPCSRLCQSLLAELVDFMHILNGLGMTIVLVLHQRYHLLQDQGQEGLEFAP